MATGQGGEYTTIPGLVASGTLATSQYKIVKPASTAGGVIVGAAATDSILGVLQNDAGDGEAALIASAGVCRVLAEASVAAGDHVACSTTGRAKTTTTGNDHVLGVAVEASGAAGEYITVILSLGNY
jgi:predicted RecA/RadA family phage recombinase